MCVSVGVGDFFSSFCLLAMIRKRILRRRRGGFSRCPATSLKCVIGAACLSGGETVEVAHDALLSFFCSGLSRVACLWFVSLEVFFVSCFFFFSFFCPSPPPRVVCVFFSEECGHTSNAVCVFFVNFFVRLVWLIVRSFSASVFFFFLVVLAVIQQQL